jgi:hypothetical protein
MTDQPDVKMNEIDNLPEEATRRGEHSEQQVAHALQRYRSPTIPVLFNRKERKLVQDELVAELAQGFEHHRKAIGMALETRLHSIREACNHVLVTGKTHLRQQRLEYFGEVLRQVEKRMADLSEDFMQDTDERLEQLGKYRSEAIREREKARLEKSVDNFLETLDSLMEEFRNIINEHIDHNESAL